MKVGTDGVLLGAWVTISTEDKTIQSPETSLQSPDAGLEKLNNNNRFSVLDIGTGTGLIAMIIAQRNSNAIIDAIDIDKNACEQAINNIDNSPFKGRINVFHKSFSIYSTEKKYDLIISNPPFIKNSLKCPDEKRNLARHNDSLPLKLLIERSATMLSKSGRIALILPVQLSEELDFIIATHRLFIVRRTEIIPVEGFQSKRFLIEISAKNISEKEVCSNSSNILVLKTKDRQRTQQYKELTKELYL